MLVRNTKHDILDHVAIIMDGNGRWAQNKGGQDYLVIRLVQEELEKL